MRDWSVGDSCDAPFHKNQYDFHPAIILSIFDDHYARVVFTLEAGKDDHIDLNECEPIEMYYNIMGLDMEIDNFDQQDPRCQKRFGSLVELCKCRRNHPDLALVLWKGIGIIPSFLENLFLLYPYLQEPKKLSGFMSSFGCNTMVLIGSTL